MVEMKDVKNRVIAFLSLLVSAETLLEPWMKLYSRRLSTEAYNDSLKGLRW